MKLLSETEYFIYEQILPLSMMLNKRGQAAGTAVLLAIIAGLIIMFVVLSPPQERADLLGEDLDDDSDTTDDDDDEIEKNLLLESPGRIDYLAQEEIEHSLPVINIFTKTEGEVIAEKSFAYAQKGLFSEETSPFTFSIADLDNTENVYLNFNVKEVSERLIITLNGEKLYNAPAPPGSISPISLPKNMLQEDNFIIFTASSPGVALWKTNKITLENLKIIGDVKNIDAQSSRNIFLVSETEKSNLEKAVLKFQPTCRYGEVGKLSIRINDMVVYESIPDCDLALIPIEFSDDLVKEGENEVIFHTEKGTYLLSHVLVESKLKELDFPTYYFDLSQERYEDIQNEKLRMRLKIDFVDVVTRKRGELVLNGHVRNFDTKEAEFTIDLSDSAVKGTNSLKIKPRKTVEVRELRLDLLE